MIKVILIHILIATILFFVGKYFWVRIPTDITIKYDRGVCEPPDQYLSPRIIERIINES